MSIVAEFPDLKPFLYDIQSRKDLSINTILKSRKNILDLKIVVMVDVSGSIGQETFENFMKQIDKIKGLSMVKVLEFDTRVVACYSYFKTAQNEVMRLRGGGGTYFQPVFDQAKKMKPDSLVLMTDGENFDELENPGIPTGLVLTEGGPNKYNWMKKIGEVPNSSSTCQRRTEEQKSIDDEMKNDNDTLGELEEEPEDEFEGEGEDD